MKKITAIICTLALLTAFTGCDSKETSGGVPESTENSDSAPISTDDPESAPDSSENPESDPESSESKSEQKLSDEQLKMISELDIQSFAGPDGETVRAADAADVFKAEAAHTKDGSPGFKMDSAMKSDDIEIDSDGNLIEPEIESTVLRYDFAYLRYCRPLFYKGELLDEADEQKMIDELPDDKWFKVRAGDKLDCGLTVKKSVYERFPVETSFPTRDNYVEFDGELTLEGLLYTITNDRDYLVKQGDLTFIPDPTKTSNIPDCTQQVDPENVIRRSVYGEDYVLTDGGATWIVGTVDGIDKDYIFGDDELVRVKVTLKNIRYGGIFTCDMPAFYAEIADIDRIDE